MLERVEPDAQAWWPASEVTARITAGDVSASEVTEAALARIERLNDDLGAFLTVTPDEARAEAAAADAAERAGEPLGPLHGVPVSLKDEVWTAGVRSTAGSRLYSGFVPDVDAEAVRRLRRAGAVVVGKTQLPEFAMWPRSTNLVGPEARNPHDRDRISGVSSGGSAASVASGMVPISLGSDGGGSIRIPSALCGTFGLFPTPGLVPATNSFSYSPFASLGPITRTVRDAAVMLQVLAGHDPDDPGSRAGDVPDYLAELEAGVRGVRVAFTPDFGWIDVDPGVAACTARAVQALATLGAIVEQPVIEIEDIWPPFTTVSPGAALYGAMALPFTQSPEHLALVAANLDQLTPPLAAALDRPPPTRADYDAAMVVIDRVRDCWRDLFGRYDVVCSPTMAVVAPLIPAGWEMPYPDGRMGTNFLSMANVGRMPAASYPCGMVDGLPVGLQVVGPASSEALVLRVCRAAELAVPFTARPG